MLSQCQWVITTHICWQCINFNLILCQHSSINWSHLYKSVEPQNAKFTLEQPLNNHQIIHICLHDSRHFNHNLLGNPIICHANEQTLEMPFQHIDENGIVLTQNPYYNSISRHIGNWNEFAVCLVNPSCAPIAPFSDTHNPGWAGA